MISYLTIIISGIIHTRDESLQNWLRDVNLWSDLGFSLCAILSNCHIVTILDRKKKSKIEVSTDWYITIKH